jgi:four helix bundle protein
MELVLEVYRCTKTFPREEIYGPVAQKHRAAASTPSNMAEGKGRYSYNELTHFLFNARVSLLELETQAMMAEKLGYLYNGDAANLASRSAEVGRLLTPMIYRFKEPTTY